MSVRQDLIKGVFWSAIEKYSGLLVGLIISAVLARIISPEDFGVMSIATVIINFLTLFATMGIYPAIIQHQDLSEKNLDSIFTFTILLGCVLAFVFFILSWPISCLYDNAILIPICQILSVNVFFAALNLVPNALMAKHKRFKYIALRTLLLQIATGITSIIMAYYGFGVYALLISPVLTSIGIFLYNIRYYPRRIDFSLDISSLKKIYSYSAFQFLFDFTNYFSRNLDKLIIGRYMSMNSLGYYDKSYRLMMLPLQNVTYVITPVMLPILAALQDDKRELSLKYNKIIKFIASISFPLAVFLHFSAYELIHIVYGNNWDAAIPVFRILTLSLPLQMIMSSAGAIFQASNSTREMFSVGLRNTSCTIAGLCCATFLVKTIESIAWSWCITVFINFIFSYITLYHKILCSSFISMILELKIPFLTAILLSIFINSIDLLQLQDVFYSLSLKSILSFFVVALTYRYTHIYNASVLRTITWRFFRIDKHYNNSNR